MESIYEEEFDYVAISSSGVRRSWNCGKSARDNVAVQRVQQAARGHSVDDLLLLLSSSSMHYHHNLYDIMRFLTILASLVPVLASLEERTSCPTASPAALQNVKKAFTTAGLVPAYISSFNPTLLANVTYPQATGGSATVALGNIFNTTRKRDAIICYVAKIPSTDRFFQTPETLIQPTVLLTAEKDQPANTTYSLFFINFDNPVPSAPPSAHLPFLHWQESGLTPCNGAPGNQVQAFIPSVPQSVDQNRYTYLIFREPAGYVANPITTADRIILNVVATAAAQGLKLVGGNYFLEGEIDNVP